MLSIKSVTLALLPAFALAALPMIATDASAAMKKKAGMAKAAKGQPAMKGGAMKAGDSKGDPLAPAAGKKM